MSDVTPDIMVPNGVTYGSGKCTECKNRFTFTGPRKTWAFRNRNAVFCSWGCLQAWRGKHPTKKDKPAVVFGKPVTDLNDQEKEALMDAVSEAAERLETTEAQSEGTVTPAQEAVIDRLAEAIGSRRLIRREVYHGVLPYDYEVRGQDILICDLRTTGDGLPVRKSDLRALILELEALEQELDPNDDDYPFGE